MTRSRTLGVLLGTAALLAAAAPAAAQDDAAGMTEMSEMSEMPTLEVSGVEYAFVGLPESVPAGTEVTFRNDGAELHEIIIVRIADDTTESLEELLAMGDEAMVSGKVEMVGEGPLITGPDSLAEGSLTLEREGDYLALCFIPTGFDPMALEAAGISLDDMGPDMDVAALPEDVQAILANPPHLAQGMIQAFTVTAAEMDAT